MQFMECQTCRSLVQVNNTGVCLGCQRGFLGVPQEDVWKPEEEKSLTPIIEDKKMDALTKRKEEIEDALQIRSTEKVDVQPESKNGRKMAKRDSKRSKTSKKEDKT